MTFDYFAQFYVQSYFGDFYFLEGSTATSTVPPTATATGYSDYFLDSFFLPSYYPQYYMDLIASSAIPTTPQSGRKIVGNGGVGLAVGLRWQKRRRTWGG